MVHVLYVITKSNWGGAQRYVYDLATHPQPGFRVTVVAGGAGPLIDRLKEAGVRTIQLPALQRDVNLFKDLWSMVELFNLCRSEKPDVVHLNSSKVGALGALAARLAGVPRIIFTAHNWFHNESRPAYIRAITWVIQACTQLWVHQTIAVSDAMVRTAPFPTRCVRIYNGIHAVPHLERTPARAALTEKGALLDDRLALVTIGELHKNKGHDILLKALATLTTPVTLTIIGDGEERQRTEVLIRELKLTNVSLVGHVDAAATYLKAFDIFVLPSCNESFGFVLLEAALAGLPVVATTVGGVPEIVTPETGVLVPPESPDELARGLETLLTHADVRTRLSVALAHRATHTFSTERMVQETYAQYV